MNDTAREAWDIAQAMNSLSAMAQPRVASPVALGNRVQGHADLPPQWAQLREEQDAVAAVYDLDEGDIARWWLEECHDEFRALVFAIARGSVFDRWRAERKLSDAIHRSWPTCIEEHLGDDALNPSGISQEQEWEEQQLTREEVSDALRA